MMSLEKKKVMVAIDESEFSHYALDWALKHLNLIGSDSDSDSDLLIFTVQSQSDFNYVYPCTFGAAHPELIRNIQENQKKVALALLDKAKEMCSKHGIIPETMTEVGDPKVAICEAVEKLNIQLLVMGSHGRGSVKRAFLGSVSNYCLSNVKCPVLVVKKPV